jgi:uncharacterized membrane protein
MTMLIFGMILFFGAHSVSIVAHPLRERLVASMGAATWKGLYSLVSLGGLLLMISGYSVLRLEPHLVYVPPAGLRHAAALLMLPVFPLLLATYLPGRIRRIAKHPMLVAVKFWALAHLLANGMLADVLLFGGFLAWAIADRISLKRRVPRPSPAAPERPYNDAIVIVVGLALYGAFAMLWHVRLFGVAPFG